MRTVPVCPRTSTPLDTRPLQTNTLGSEEEATTKKRPLRSLLYKRELCEMFVNRRHRKV